MTHGQTASSGHLCLRWDSHQTRGLPVLLTKGTMRPHLSMWKVQRWTHLAWKHILVFLMYPLLDPIPLQTQQLCPRSTSGSDNLGPARARRCSSRLDAALVTRVAVEMQRCPSGVHHCCLTADLHCQRFRLALMAVGVVVRIERCSGGGRLRQHILTPHQLGYQCKTSVPYAKAETGLLQSPIII